MRFLPDRPSNSSFLHRGHGLAAAALLFGLVSGASALPAGSRGGDGELAAIALRPRIGGEPATLLVSGNWPTPCTPTFESANLNGAELRINARSVLSLCARETSA